MKRLTLLATTVLLVCACHERTISSLPTGPTTPLPPVVRSDVYPSVADATPIPPGESITARVEMDAPHCFPNWDSLGRCRAFRLAATADGPLAVTLTWTTVKGEWDPDLFLVRPDAGWDWGGEGGSPRTFTVPVRSGLTYHIVVMSYLPAAQEFVLSTELR